MPAHKVLLCTSGDIRHKYVASKLAMCDLNLLVIHEQNITQASDIHFEARTKAEFNFFADEITKEYSSHHIPSNRINSKKVINLIQNFKPDTFVTYGCGIINQTTILGLECRKINIHLGLSPYYRGTGTNFWPIFNNEIRYCGATFHELTSRIDGGSIFHQFSVDRQRYDSVHHIGNSIIKRIPEELLKVLTKQSEPIDQIDSFFPNTPRFYYKKSDYSIEKAELVNLKFEEFIENFLNESSRVKIKTI
jgi:phosphoribosylglycinamide formyltransferase 1